VRSRRWWRALGGVAGASVLLVALVGVAHTAMARPVLRRLGLAMGGGGRGCPLGYDRQAKPADRENERARFRLSHQGTEPAATRPALGFVLGRTTRDEVKATLASLGVTCRESRAFADLTCDDVPNRAAWAGSPGVSAPLSRNMWFTFGVGRQLIAVVAISRDAHPGPISAAFSDVEDAIRRAAGAGAPAGAVGRTSGDSSPSALAAGLLRQASAEFRFSNYYALARATNMGNGFMLTEEYRSLID
jgi:hypothetical protein